MKFTSLAAVLMACLVTCFSMRKIPFNKRWKISKDEKPTDQALRLLEEGFKKRVMYHAEVVLIIGKIEIGKSTFASFMSHEKLTSIDRFGRFDVNDTKGRIGLGVADHPYTIYPELYLDKKHKLAYFDIPGYGSVNDALYETVSKFFTFKLMNFIKSIRVLITFSEKNFGSERAIISSLQAVFRSVLVTEKLKIYVESVGLVITFVESSEHNSVVKERYRDLLQRTLNHLDSLHNIKPDMKENIEILLRHLIVNYQHIILFRTVKGAGNIYNLPTHSTTSLDSYAESIKNLKKFSVIKQGFIMVKTKFESKMKEIRIYAKAAVSKLNQLVDDIEQKVHRFFMKIAGSSIDYKMSEDTFGKWIKIFSENLERMKSVCSQTRELCFDTIFKKFWEMQIDLPNNLQNKIKQIYEYLFWIERSSGSKKFLFKTKLWVDKLKIILDYLQLTKNHFYQLRKYVLKKSESNYRQSKIEKLDPPTTSCCGNYILEKKIFPKAETIKAVQNENELPKDVHLLHGLDHMHEQITNDAIFQTPYEGIDIKCYYLHPKNYLNIRFMSSYISFEQIAEFIQKHVDHEQYLCAGHLNLTYRNVKRVEIFSFTHIDMDYYDITELFQKVRNVAWPIELAIISPKWIAHHVIKLSLNGISGADRVHGAQPTMDGVVGGPGTAGAAFLGVGEKFDNTRLLYIESIGGRGGHASPGWTGRNGEPGWKRSLSFDQCMSQYNTAGGFLGQLGFTINSHRKGICKTWHPRPGWRNVLYEVQTVNWFYWFQISNAPHTLEGLPGEKGQKGGDGAVGGFGGKGNDINIINLGVQLDGINTNRSDGERGRWSVGGEGGWDGNHDCTFTYGRKKDEWKIGNSFCNLDFYEWGYDKWSYRRDGSNAYVTKGLIEPDPAEPFYEPWRVINDYKSFLRSNLKIPGFRHKVLEFYYKLENEKKIQSIYSPLGYLHEFVVLELQYEEIKNDPNTTDFYISLQERVLAKKKSCVQPSACLIILNMVHTSVRDKLNNLQYHDVETRCNINVGRSLSEINNTIRSYRKLYVAEKKRHQIENEIRELSYKFDQTQAQINKFKEDFAKDINDLKTQLYLVVDEMNDYFKDSKQPKSIVNSLAAKFFDIVRVALLAIIHILPAFSEGKFLRTIVLLALNIYRLLNGKASAPGVLQPPSKEVAWQKFTDLTNADIKDDLINVTNVKKAFTCIYDAVQSKADDEEKQRYDDFMVSLNSMDNELKLSNYVRLREMVQYSLRIAHRAGKKVLKNILNIFNPLTTAQSISIMSSNAEHVHKLISNKNLLYYRIIPSLANFSEIIDTINFVNITNEQLDAYNFEDQWARMANDITATSQPFSQFGRIRSLCSQVEFFLYQMISNSRTIKSLKSRLDVLSKENYLVDDEFENQIESNETRSAIQEMKLIVQRNKIFHEYKAAGRIIDLMYFPFKSHFIVEQVLNYADDKGTNAYQINDYIKVISDKVESIMKNYTSFKSSKLADKMKQKYFDFNFAEVDNTPLFTWPYDIHSKIIDSLLDGQREYFYADIRGIDIDYDVIKFREIGIKFSSKMFNTNEQEEICSKAIEKIQNCNITMIASGDSLYRCNGKIYQYPTGVIELKHSFGALGQDGYSYKYENENYTLLKEEPYLLSPYTMWSIKLECDDESRGYQQQLKGLVDMHLHGLASYIHKEDTPDLVPYLQNDMKLVEPVI